MYIFMFTLSIIITLDSWSLEQQRKRGKDEYIFSIAIFLLCTMGQVRKLLWAFSKLALCNDQADIVTEANLINMRAMGQVIWPPYDSYGEGNCNP